MLKNMILKEIRDLINEESGPDDAKSALAMHTNTIMRDPAVINAINALLKVPSVVDFIQEDLLQDYGFSVGKLLQSLIVKQINVINKQKPAPAAPVKKPAPTAPTITRIPQAAAAKPAASGVSPNANVFSR